MQTTAFIEDATQGILTTLQNTLALRLADVWAKYAAADVARAQPVPMPTSIRYVYGRHEPQGSDLILIMVYSNGMKLKNPGQTSASQGWAEYVATVTVEFVVISDNATVLARIHDRLVEALFLAIYPNQGASVEYNDLMKQVRLVRYGGRVRISAWDIDLGIDAEYR